MLLFGCVFALFSRKPVGRFVFADAYFWHGFIFISIFNIVVFVSALHFPHWMWMYFLDKSQHSVLELIYIFLFLYYFPYALGYYFGRDLKRLSLVWGFLFILFMAVTEGWLIWQLFDRYSVIGTLQEFQAGQAVSLFGPQNPLKNLMNGCLGLMIFYFMIVVFYYRQENQMYI